MENTAAMGFDLISQMVNETFEQVDKTCSEYEVDESFQLVVDSQVVVRETEPTQLEFFFDYFMGAYDETRKCYVFQVEGQVIEFPENWGPFKLATQESGQVGEMFSLKKHQDIDYFMDIFEVITDQSFKKIKCINSGDHIKITYELDTEVKNAEIIEFTAKSKQHLAIAA